MLKTLAGGYVTAADIDKLKEKHIRELKQMSEEDFRGKYGRIFEVLRACSSCKTKFGLSAEMTREQFIARLQSFNKKDMYAVINSIPDEVVVRQYRRYLEKMGGEEPHDGIAQQVTGVWASIKARVEGR